MHVGGADGRAEPPAPVRRGEVLAEGIGPGGGGEERPKGWESAVRTGLWSTEGKMRALLICVVAVVFFLQYAESNQGAGSSSSLQCYQCFHPAECLKKKTVTCKVGEVCQRAQRKAHDANTHPEPGDEFGTIGGAIMHRRCNTAAACQRESKNKLVVVSCCENNLCNN
ncbi:hypothetical protein NDU88_004555 [Pleurodeles waltl]|uniref:Uncharacterized protein n=1 Tax=Pleurodeles waltl TaxID=8319 RepID=A0AAV7PFK4_PLEWA|nr:hypothetical protein NDU88_004555 [Pleurodeles waltl]